jgi:hypothetical protein
MLLAYGGSMAPVYVKKENIEQYCFNFACLAATNLLFLPSIYLANQPKSQFGMLFITLLYWCYGLKNDIFL